MRDSRFSDKAKASLESVVDCFRRGDIAATCALATYPTPDIPAADWSLHNRWLCLIQSGEVDCRGFRQWQEVGRKVKKGAKAAFILRPKTVQNKHAKDDEDKLRVIGFATIAVFSAKQTEGDPLKYEEVKLPELPLLSVAKAWGLTVSAEPFTQNYLGYYSGARRTIVLCTSETSVFLHELCHAAHELIRGKLKGGQDAMQEIVAELGSEVLRRLLGSKKDTSGNAYAYIENYAKKQKKSVLSACLATLSETAKVVGLILEAAEQVKEESAIGA